jgi:hypothetical protein
VPKTSVFSNVSNPHTNAGRTGNELSYAGSSETESAAARRAVRLRNIKPGAARPASMGA